MVAANSIAEVITNLDAVIAWSKQNRSRMGYFAVLYRRMTLAIQEGIRQKKFEDGARMEKLDTCFANRYLQAWQAYTHQQKSGLSWQHAFNACTSNNLAVIQHL